MEEASVAGESPDRSKQRQSSAEPTSGNAGPVPEARDPRLAVSREKDSSSSGVDTATKILSVRETPEEDTALRDAVSAWVRAADTPEKAEQNQADDGKKPDTNAKPKPETAPEAEADAKPKPETAPAPDADAKAKPDSAADTGAKAKPGTAPEAEADAKPKPEAAPAPAADAKPMPETTPGPDAEAKAKPETAAEGGTDVKPKPETTPAPAADAKAKPDSTAGADGGAEADGKTEAEDAEGEAEAEGAEDAPEDADGEDTPQGPPAADDETRTGGAGGNGTDAEGEAEAEGAEGTHAVDQPTTLFKAISPRPAPQVDQPTTMLKLGARPTAPKGTPASDPERTSKFVALKNDMAPATKPATEPAAKPASRPAGKPDATTPVPHVGPERTTQQPLPPKPPLDLLAELTNTPPPPETPVRTIVRRVKIWTPLVLLLAIVFAVVQTLRPLPSPTLALTGKDTYTFDGGTTALPWPGEGQGWIDVAGIGTMGHFGKQTPVAIGSVAKTMTSYIILRDHPLKPGQEGPRITVDPRAEKEGGYSKSGESTVNTLHAGDRLTEKQALSAVMIPSANNIARLLARWDAGSEAAFVKKMNATAKELGMTNTTYTDPSGLKETTVSTAEDQVKLGRLVVKNPALVAITSAASWTDPTGHNWPNWNKLPFQMGAIGIKTGSTTAAGGNLLFASRKTVGGQTVTIVGAILGQHRGTSILDTVNAVSKTALLAAQDALTSSTILKKGAVVGYVDDQLGGHTPVVLTKDVPAVGWAGLKVNLSFTSGKVPHSAKAGTRVGALTVGDGSAGAVKIPVALQKDLAEPGFGAKLTRLG
ncbi:D-alanyl-D-alanine carboxypeptidase [Streptomyces sp. NPDC053069]|uniref:D-alanyl-D-alanine carboxypeptidase n=1 Tax=Streptomyces sp. NPDC053069 TaxID=3365695 RepID=UPI0037CF4C49